MAKIKINPDGIWRYQLQEDYVLKSPHLKGVDFRNDWLYIHDGTLVITAHYAWDGCTPKYYLPFVGWVGVPDGSRDANGYPQAYYASLVHDAFCQFRSSLWIRKQVTLDVFKDLLLEGGFSRARAEIYTGAVKLFGPQVWLGDALPA